MMKITDISEMSSKGFFWGKINRAIDLIQISLVSHAGLKLIVPMRFGCFKQFEKHDDEFTLYQVIAYVLRFRTNRAVITSMILL